MNKTNTNSNEKPKFYQQEYFKNIFIFGLFILFFAIFSFTAMGFLSYSNLINFVRVSIFPVLTGLAATMLMVSGNLDLSVGSNLAVSSIIFAITVKAGIPIPVALLIAILSGATVGFVNSISVVRLKITPVIATLGTSFLFRGITFIVAGNNIIRDLPESFSFLGRGSIGPVPFQLILMVVFIAIFIILEKKSLLWKYAVAIGGNPTAAKLSGINTKLIVSLLFIITGAFAGLSGAIMASKLTVGQKLIGYGFELDVIIAVLLGGTSFRGGEGTIIGTVIGAFIISIISLGFNMSGLPAFYQYIAKGALLIIAMLLDNFVKSKLKKI